MLRGLNHITIAVSNLDTSLAFYSELLGMKAHVRWDKGAYLSLGGDKTAVEWHHPVSQAGYIP